MKKGIEKTTIKKQVIVLLIVNDVIDLSKTVSFMKVASNSTFMKVASNSSCFSAYWFRTLRFTFENLDVQGVESFEEGD